MTRLENDLRALRLLHDKVIDTAVVRLPRAVPISMHLITQSCGWTSSGSENAQLSLLDTDVQLIPHPKGKPYRRALRDLYASSHSTPVLLNISLPHCHPSHHSSS